MSMKDSILELAKLAVHQRNLLAGEFGVNEVTDRRVIDAVENAGFVAGESDDPEQMLLLVDGEPVDVSEW